MNGIDQILIALWFLPVVLFIIVPLIIGFVWMPISFLVDFFQSKTKQEEAFQPTIYEARSAA